MLRPSRSGSRGPSRPKRIDRLPQTSPPQPPSPSRERGEKTKIRAPLSREGEGGWGVRSVHHAAPLLGVIADGGAGLSGSSGGLGGGGMLGTLGFSVLPGVGVAVARSASFCH